MPGKASKKKRTATSKAKKPAAKSRAAPAKAKAVPDEADPRFVPVADALRGTRGFSLMESKSRALRGLMFEGKSFGMSSHGRFILKLDEERAAKLIAEGVAKSFGPAPGRVMKGWVEVTHPQADWVALAKQALGLAALAKNRSQANRAAR